MNAVAMIARGLSRQVYNASSPMTWEQEREIRGRGDAEVPASQQTLADPEHVTLSCEDVEA